MSEEQVQANESTAEEQAPDQAAALVEETQQATEAAPETTEQEADGLSPEDAQLAKLQGVNVTPVTPPEEKDAGGGDAQPQEGKPKTEPAGDSAETSEDSAKLDPDLVKFAKAKGVDEEALAGNEVLQKQMKNYKEAEARGNRLQSEKDKAKESEVAEAAEAVQETQSGPPPDSPIGKVNALYGQAFKSLCVLNDCNSVEELAQNFPKAYKKLNAEYEVARQNAIAQEVDWRFEQRDRQAKEQQQQEKLRVEMETVKRTYKENLDEARKSDPQVETNLFQSGAMGAMQRIGNALQFPVDYLTADPETFQFMAKAAKAITAMDNLPALKEQWKQEYEANRKKAASANLPAPGNPVPEQGQQDVLSKIYEIGQGGGVSVL